MVPVTFLTRFLKNLIKDSKISVKFCVLTCRAELMEGFGCVQVTTDPDPGNVIRNTAVHDARYVGTWDVDGGIRISRLFRSLKLIRA
jgi:hypothetical protein